MAEPRVVMLSVIAPRVGGAERQTQRLAQALARQGTAVRILTPRDSPDLPENDTIAGISVYRVRYPRVRGAGAAILLARVLWNLLRSHDNVIHVHTPGLMLIPAVLAARIRGVPVVLKFTNLSPEHGIWVQVPQGLPHRWAIKNAARRVDGIVAISSRIARIVEDASWPQVARIPNGIDLTTFSVEYSDRSRMRRALAVQGDPVALFVGGLRYQKGVDVLLKAWAKFLRHHPRGLLLVLGDGPDGLRLRHQAEALGISESVDFRGLREDVGPHYAAADLFVLPSRYEGFPNVLLEAMSARLPVIASRVSGSEDAIEDGLNGLLVPPAETEPLLEALLRLSGDRRMAERLGAEARKTVERRYDINRVAEETLAFYDRLINRS
jgi:glycosyltransferase involved in cell wall biosynthesis